MHFDGAPTGHQVRRCGTTKGRPKNRSGKNPDRPWSALQASSQGRNRATLTMVTRKIEHVALLSRRSSVTSDYTKGGADGKTTAFTRRGNGSSTSIQPPMTATAPKPWIAVSDSPSMLVPTSTATTVTANSTLIVLVAPILATSRK